MAVSVKAGGSLLPSPAEMSVSDEIIWSANTGRTASGRMLGDAVAEKRTVALRWGVLTAAELGLIRGKLTSGFCTVTVTVDGESVSMSCYRGTLTAAVLGTYGGVTYYSDVRVNLIQQ